MSVPSETEPRCVAGVSRIRQCVFDLDEDTRRKLPHKRKLNKMEENRDLLHQFVRILRDSTDDKALLLLGLR
ncbi:hypothetical protein AnigIFM63604_003494 [Aspergillus niger]|uniref:Uncharacterized protein n=1 Tax=Aspergillus niger TaxID=5061 RepID=A0A9W6EGD7_ASPNG|nr:hypothetical protein AnigIFM63604_003494 [Aspergillus niger]